MEECFKYFAICVKISSLFGNIPYDWNSSANRLKGSKELTPKKKRFYKVSLFLMIIYTLITIVRLIHFIHTSAGSTVDILVHIFWGFLYTVGLICKFMIILKSEELKVMINALTRFEKQLRGN